MFCPLQVHQISLNFVKESIAGQIQYTSVLKCSLIKWTRFLRLELLSNMQPPFSQCNAICFYLHYIQCWYEKGGSNICRSLRFYYIHSLYFCVFLMFLTLYGTGARVSSQFHQEFPSLQAAGEVEKGDGQEEEPYGPGPSLRPQSMTIYFLYPPQETISVSEVEHYIHLFLCRVRCGKLAWRRWKEFEHRAQPSWDGQQASGGKQCRSWELYTPGGGWWGREDRCLWWSEVEEGRQGQGAPRWPLSG